MKNRKYTIIPPVVACLLCSTDFVGIKIGMPNTHSLNFARLIYPIKIQNYLA